ncbi:peptidase M23-like protein [Stella humosa]|uniref:Peptidase M23-like protein n=1 Tax=Stella humosa TaxID=94 RepID=A0A3N1KP10_9PROT|nr:M23 family metallopeptidase [Stella humosa]ROP83433.1 peptidase M23-like protein [Stella humosa]BBK33295.1 peptidase M23 [Stella humosa]
MFMPVGLRRPWTDNRAKTGGVGQQARRVAVAAALSLPAIALPWLAAADTVRLGLPIQCRPGTDCWVVNYVDQDPGPGRKDYRCGVMSYDGHNGTDIAIRDLKAMKEGVPVLAAAAGVVRAIRDEMDDVNFRDIPADAIAKRECGNAVILDHGDGWQTQYCHMRRGSVRVKPRDQVAAGQPIGLVGMSGKTEFPHIHVTVRHQGQMVDPFLGKGGGEACQAGREPLWHPDVAAALPYKAGAVHIAGIAAGKPDLKKARAGELATASLPADTDMLVVWTEVYNVVTDDTLQLRLLAPDGRVLLDSNQKIEKDQARIFRSVGRKRPGAAWPPGIYKAEITYARAGKPLSEPVRTEVTIK